MPPVSSQSIGTLKRPLPVHENNDDRSNDINAGARPSTSFSTLIRPASGVWGSTNTTPSAFLRSATSVPEFHGFGSSADTPPAKRPRLSPTPEPTEDRARKATASDESESPPQVHHMFDVTGRVPPPRSQHSSPDQGHDSDDEDLQMEDRDDFSGRETDEERSSGGYQADDFDYEEQDVRPGPSTRPPSLRSLSQTRGRKPSVRPSAVSSPSPESVASMQLDPENDHTQIARPNRRKMSISNLMSPHANQGNENSMRSSQERRSQSGSIADSVTVTLLLEDKRGEEIDHQMAEVNVVIVSDPDNGNWLVRSEDVVNALQKGPSRIEGSGKLFCFKNNPKDREGTRLWKQCILRMEIGEKPLVSTGLIPITSALEMQLVVESILPKPIPRTTVAPVTVPPVATRQLAGKVVSGGQPREDGRVAIPPTPAALRPRTSVIPALNVIRSSSVKLQHPKALWPRNKTEESKFVAATAPVKADGNENNKQASKIRQYMVDYVQPLIQKDPFWPTFQESKGHVKSNADAVKCMLFFQSLVDQYSNHIIPPQIPYIGGKRLTKAALLAAVDRGTTWGSDCGIILNLVSRFGKGGPDEHPEVVELLDKPPGDKKGGASEFASRLKQIQLAYDSRQGTSSNVTEAGIV